MLGRAAGWWRAPQGALGTHSTGPSSLLFGAPAQMLLTTGFSNMLARLRLRQCEVRRPHREKTAAVFRRHLVFGAVPISHLTIGSARTLQALKRAGATRDVKPGAAIACLAYATLPTGPIRPQLSVLATTSPGSSRLRLFMSTCYTMCCKVT